MSADRPRYLTDDEINRILDVSVEDDSDDAFGDVASDDGDADYEPETIEDCIVSENDIANDLDDDDAVVFSENGTQYLSKDKDITWYTTPSRNGLSRTAAESIIHGCMGVTSFAVQRISELKDSFNLCVTEAMKKDIIRFSNIEGKRVDKNFQEIDMIEFDAYLGLLLLIGVYRSYGESIRSLWDKVHGRPIFRAVMSVGSFLDISRALAFNDRQARSSHGARGDKLEPIRDFYEKWNENLSYLYEGCSMPDELYYEETLLHS